MTPVKRQAALRSLAHLLLEASGVATWEAGDDLAYALLPATVLQRKAVVYVRQSTPQQVQSNLESQRRQYELVDVTRRRGFTNVEIIDDDLGRSASGAVDRPGFDRLVAALCAGQVGAVLCLDARDSLAMAATGTISWSCADWWMPVSSTSMACTTRAGQTTACCSA
jgi:hypothetical protein